MKNDLEISQETQLKPIVRVADSIGINEDDLELYGKYKAKINFTAINDFSEKEDGRLILVTSINPTPAGEGKSTVTVGLGDALNQIDKKAVIALREPSLGPVMGIKGGATGVATHKYYQWKISICILLAICMPLLLQTMHCQLY